MPATPATRNSRSVVSRNQSRERRLPECQKDGRKLLVEFVSGAREEAGCKPTSLLEDRKQAGRFLTFET
jgi:hypothetical protein